MAAYRPRLADARLAELLDQFPAVLINGPRAVGKTTTARRLAADVVHLDRPAEATVFRADPDAALRRRREPLLLDEWQEAPEVLGAVKRAVDEDSRPARFILTGSVRAELEQRLWPGTGRIIRLQMHGMTQAEIEGRVAASRTTFLERLTRADPGMFLHATGRPALPDYIDMAVRGGFPEVALTQRSEAEVDTWLDSYLGELITRDLHPDPRRDTGKMRQYFETLALNTAGLPETATLSSTVGITAKTAATYDALFESLFITERIPAWSHRRLRRLVRSPKRYVIDPALAAAASRLSADAILADGDLVGRMFETFGVAQIRPEAAVGVGIRMHHLRTKAGREEIDLVIEVDGQEIVGIEFKATAVPTAADARHLAWLRDRLGDRFLVGAVLHTGPDAFRLGDKLLAVPLCLAWEQ